MGMKTWLISFFVIVFTSLLSCNEKTVNPIDTVTQAKSGWTTIELNTDYTIQFPENQYVGSGFKLRTSSSDFGDKPTFINRKDEQATINATFCNPSAYPCSLIYYGERLAIPLTASIPFRNAKGEDDVLPNRVTFGTANNLFAVLYYGENTGVTLRTYEGRLYTLSRTSGSLQLAGSVRFSEATKAEIIAILSTITPK
jgi:hypothetical protein